MIKLVLFCIPVVILLIILGIAKNKYKDIYSGKDIFYFVSAWAFDHKNILGNRREKLIENCSVENMLITLNPKEEVEGLKREYTIGKIRIGIIAMFTGNMLAIAICLSGINSEELVDGRYLKRNSYGEMNVIEDMHVEAMGLPFSEDLSIEIESQKYTEEQLDNYFDRYIDEIDTLICGENSELDEVRSDLRLQKDYEGYPFRVAWNSNSYEFMNSEGKLKTSEISEDGEVIILDCVCSYGDWSKKYEFPIKVYPPQYSEYEKWRKAVYDELQAAQETTNMDNYLLLPDVADDTELIWTRRNSDNSLVVYFLLTVVGIGCFFLKDKDLKKEIKKRSEEIENDYCSLINKIAIYMAAGMTTKAVFLKIGDDYRKNPFKDKRYIYEEILLTCNELKNGVSENYAYEKFATRCGSGNYTRLVGLLTQNLKKGNASVISDLKREAYMAQNERQNKIRKKGEEAGTKLLGPMMIMLGIVMVLIMVPAFMSFAM